MADLVTHVSSALLVKAGTRRPHAVLLATGVLLPDIAARAPGIMVDILLPAGEPPLLAVLLGAGLFHTPVGVALTAALLSLLFVERQRLLVFWNLLAGGLLHIAVDLLQRHEVAGYALAAPFSYTGFELGWISTEATLWVAPVLAPLSIWSWLRRRPGPRS